MIFHDFQDLKLSMLGMGCMRLPMLEDKSGVDEARTEEMVRYAMEQGVNYFDVAWPYHGGTAEIIIGRILSQFPRDSYYLADKYPGHQIFSSYNPAETFETQLQKCGVEYFDFYLLHNVCENSLPTYTDPRWGIVEYFVEQKKLGRIRHLGISSHAGAAGLKEILDLFGEHIEFCQIQLNYLDWSLQDAKAKYDMLTERGIPVWVMEPLRGGRLAALNEQQMETLQALLPGASAAEWGMRWFQSLPNVKMVLTGASSMEQLRENVSVFSQPKALTPEQTAALATLADSMKNSVPCTGCRYCVESCPMGLDIPLLMFLSNEDRFAYGMNIGIRVDSLGDGKRPQDCIACGACAQICPQKIDIPAEMQRFAESLSQHPSWAQLCREREEAAKKLKG